MSVLTVRDEGPIRWLTLNRPDRRNALNPKLVSVLREALLSPGEARCIAITGAGKTFSAGADLAELQKMQDASELDNVNDSKALADLFGLIAEHPLPIIAAVNGHAIAGGAGLATACDFTLAVPGAKFGFTETRIGFVPAIILNFVMRAVGEKVARDLCLTGRLIDTEEAERLGLLYTVTDLEGAVTALGREIRAASPTAVAHTKRLFLQLRGLSLAEGLEKAAQENAKARTTKDCREGIAAFLEKRRPDWNSGS